LLLEIFLFLKRIAIPFLLLLKLKFTQNRILAEGFIAFYNSTGKRRNDDIDRGIAAVTDRDLVAICHLNK